MELPTPDVRQPVDASPAPAGDKFKPDDGAGGEHDQLEQLADRVSAARSVY